jgi:hypothetical protein
MFYLQHKEINKTKWDDCIQHAENSLIYARSFYLDAMSPGWDALIDENYNWVLPITKGRKFGINYLFQPHFTQQLGVFFKKETIIPWHEIIVLLQKKFRFWEVNWNYSTPPNLLPSSLKKNAATNFIIDLSRAYNDIYGNYQNVLKKNLKRANNVGLTYNMHEDYSKAIGFYKKYYSHRLPHLKDEHFTAFSKICERAGNTSVVCREAVDVNNKTMSIALLLCDGRRLYNIIDTTTTEGRKAQANHFLIDSIIKEYCGKELIFDFEGSDVPGIKSFYKSFGAENQPYYSIKYNNLPWPLKRFKE